MSEHHSSGRPKIVMLSTFFTPFRSGAEAMVEEVAMKLADRYDITIVTAKLSLALPRHGRVSNVTIRRVGLGLPIDKWLFPFLATLSVLRRNPQLVHAVLESYAGFTLVILRFLRPSLKRLLTLQSTNTSLFLGLIHRSAHAITAISSFLILRARNYNRNDVIYIPNGISLQMIQESAKRFQRVHGRILFVGRLEQMKGVDTLLEAFAALNNPTATLMIVGDGSKRSELEKLATELRIRERVTFEGYVAPPKIFELYAQSEVFAGLSRSEALGNVFLEAQAAGLVVVASNVGGIPEIVKDGLTGLLVSPDDPKGAAFALKKVLEDTILRQRLIEKSQEDLAQFDWSAISKRYDAVYQKLLTAS